MRPAAASRHIMQSAGARSQAGGTISGHPLARSEIPHV